MRLLLTPVSRIEVQQPFQIAVGTLNQVRDVSSIELQIVRVSDTEQPDLWNMVY
jgi:hypothetical protein